MNVIAKPGPTQLGLLKAGLFAAALLPVVRLVLLGLWDKLGANPIEFITRSSGDWTLYLLCMTLAVTPLRHLTGWNWLISFRRMLGLFTFFYASLHFLTFIWFDHFFDIEEIGKDIVKRPFITVGVTAFLLLLPLAVTSVNVLMKRLGRYWKILHRLIYLIAILALLHFWWMRAGKQNFAEPILITGIITILLMSRIFFWWRKQTRQL